MQEPQFFRTQDFVVDRGSERQLQYGTKKRQLHTRVTRSVYLEGSVEPDLRTKALARLTVSGAPATATVAGTLLGLDSVEVTKLPQRERRTFIAGDLIEVGRYRCTNGLQTIIDLAPHMSDLTWEQALESGLRMGLFTLDELVALLPELSRRRTPGVGRIRRVLDLRPHHTPPTESLLETLAVQMIRTRPDIPTPDRQVVVTNAAGEFVARVDFAWRDPGVFYEVDGSHHDDQVPHDEAREAEIIAATGWLPHRSRWKDVRYNPTHTVRRLASIIEQARRRTGA